MNSKEALKDLFFLAIGDENHTKKCKEVIEKDLKTLEILKKYVYFSNQSGCVRMKDVYKRTTSFDYEDLREWLEEY